MKPELPNLPALLWLGGKTGKARAYLVLPQLGLFAHTSVILLKHTASSPPMLENRTSSKSVSAVETLVKWMESSNTIMSVK